MYQNDESRFSKALGYMKELIDSPSFRLNPSFANIWETEGEWCDESIWEINYEQTNNERGWGSPLAVGGTVLPTLISPNSFPGDDGWSRVMMVGDLCPCVLKLIKCLVNKTNVVMQLAG